MGGRSKVWESGTEPVNFVVCRICGDKLRRISSSGHLVKHGITLDQYRDKFPEAPYTSGIYSRNLSESGLGRTMPEDHSEKVRQGLFRWLEKGNEPWTQSEEPYIGTYGVYPWI
jgi:hypothetical protein